MSSLTPVSCSQSASASVNASTPANPSWASARSISAGTRSDFEATRIGFPPARRTRSSALASNASRSTTAIGVAGCSGSAGDRRVEP